ncbi:MAG: SDR family NAD(P)-dependent oxidoreductase [Pseudomonadales bacterium]|nr:SDR family NAD(P)-dependent oxidoreductase [Pseudomonadales bacterium]NIX09163.1 SDR family NAD(P)-dependent oxidoreductase [Pseudomonadales bacterium]
MPDVKGNDRKGADVDNFEGRTAVVTGGASGIGLALAERFAAAKMQVVLADIEEAALDKAVKRLEERQARVIGVPTNTMVESSVAELADRAIAEFGKVHVLCNNAGVASLGARGRGIWEVPAADWEWVLGVNFYGVLYGIQAFVPHMLAHGEPGHIVNTASLAGLFPGGGTYGVSKHAVLSLTETLYNDLKARGAAVSASVLCPGFVSTRIAHAERNRPADLGIEQDDAGTELAAAAEALIAQGKDPAEIAQAVLEAVSRDNLYILPHPAWDDFVRARVDHVLDRHGPATLDPAELMRRRAGGEAL